MKPKTYKLCQLSPKFEGEQPLICIRAVTFTNTHTPTRTRTHIHIHTTLQTTMKLLEREREEKNRVCEEINVEDIASRTVEYDFR